MPLHEKHRDQIVRLRKLATLMDSAIGVPGTRLRFGLDPLIGLIPGIGDLAGALVSAIIVFEARRMGVPRRVHRKMMLNVVYDLVLGTIPLVGDIFDFGYKANDKNVRLLEEELGSPGG